MLITIDYSLKKKELILFIRLYMETVMYFPVQLLIASVDMHNKLFILICTSRNVLTGITSAL